MARQIGTLTNLETDGTYDILFVSFSSGYPEGKLSFEFTNTPRKVTGVQKVAQIFIYTLLTTKGVDPVKPDFGTNFSPYIVHGNRNGDLDSLYRDVAEFVLDAENQTKANLNSTNQDTASQLSSVRLIAVDGAEDSVMITIQLTTRAGESAAVAIPFPQLDLGLSNG